MQRCGVLKPGQVLEGRWQGWEERSSTASWEPRLLSWVAACQPQQAGCRQQPRGVVHWEKRQTVVGVWRGRPAALHPADAAARSQSQPAPLPSFFSCFASFQQQSQASLLLNPLDGTDRHECNCCQLAPTGPAAQSNVSTAYSSFYCPALLKLPAVASAPIHAPYWRRRGLSGQIISPPPSPQSPYQPLGRPHFKPSSTSSLCYLSPLRYVRDKRPQGRKQGWLAPEVPTTTCKAFKV